MTTTVEQCSHRRPWSTCSWSYWLYTRGREDYLLTSGQKGQRSRLLLELQVLIVTLKSPFFVYKSWKYIYFFTCVSYGQTWSDSEAAFRFWLELKIRSGWFIEKQWGGVKMGVEMEGETLIQETMKQTSLFLWFMSPEHHHHHNHDNKSAYFNPNHRPVLT